MSRPYRVLLVDDSVDERGLVRRALERTGRFVVVGEAGNGLDAIVAAEHLQPELVLLDLSMPVMDGLQALPHVRACAPGTRVVVYSGVAADKAGPPARHAGADLYLEKGLHPNVLVDELLAVLAQLMPAALSA